MKTLITGGNGQLGQELQHLLSDRNVEYTATDSKELDITDKNKVDDYFHQNHPEVVYHCAAYTAVDKAEGEGKETNWNVNAIGTKNIAQACQREHSTLVYISTDYVFNGEKNTEYIYDDEKAPKNQYGKAKFAGEKAVINYCDKYYIVRTAWVYGQYGHNFVYTMLRLAKDHDLITVVDDQVGRPTWTKTLAEFIMFLVNKRLEYGVYHCCNDGECSWYDFASEILKDKNIEVKPVTSDQFPQDAFRPKYSVMELSKETGFKFPQWQDALHEFLNEVGE